MAFICYSLYRTLKAYNSVKEAENEEVFAGNRASGHLFGLRRSEWHLPENGYQHEHPPVLPRGDHDLQFQPSVRGDHPGTGGAGICGRVPRRKEALAHALAGKRKDSDQGSNAQGRTKRHLAASSEYRRPRNGCSIRAAGKRERQVHRVLQLLRSDLSEPEHQRRIQLRSAGTGRSQERPYRLPVPERFLVTPVCRQAGLTLPPLGRKSEGYFFIPHF